MMTRDQAKAFAERVQQCGYYCKHGHLECSARENGPCLDEIFSVLGLDNDGDPIERPNLKWVVEFYVDPSWVADGFELDDERALEMLSQSLRYAHGHELDAKVIDRPDPDRVARLQGYKDAADKAKRG